MDVRKKECEKDVDICESQPSPVSLDLSSQSISELGRDQLKHMSITVLNLILNNNSLSHLPTNFVSYVPNLKVMNANGNQLRALPNDFGSLTCLTEVELCENKMTSLPSSIHYLVNLKRLVLTGNQLCCLPDNFGELFNLEELFIDQNELMQFPPTFSRLKKLRILKASMNDLCVIPEEFGSLHLLTHLILYKNRLSEFWMDFSQLKYLEHVDLSRNDLKALPSSCSSQKTLKKFYAGQNFLSEIPQWLTYLPELEELSLKENWLMGHCFPDDFGQVCKKLRFVDLSGNQLTSLPDTFGKLCHLEFADFGCPFDNCAVRNKICVLPDSFAQLTRLTRLRLHNNNITVLPEDFGSLHNLEYLDLANNMLHDLPESFGELCNLQICLLSRNELQLLPSGFGQLSALEELRLKHNQIQELPESFRQLSRLMTLDLYHNQFKHLPLYLSHMKNLTVLDVRKNPLKRLKRVYCSSEAEFDVQRTEKKDETIPGTKWGVQKNIIEMLKEPVEEKHDSQLHTSNTCFCHALGIDQRTCLALTQGIEPAREQESEDENWEEEESDISSSSDEAETDHAELDLPIDNEVEETWEDDEDWKSSFSPEDLFGENWDPFVLDAQCSRSDNQRKSDAGGHNPFLLVPSDLHAPQIDRSPTVQVVEDSQGQFSDSSD